MSAGLEPDEEPAEVEVKPILRSEVNISVVVEPPSSEDSSQARPAREEEETAAAAAARNEEQEERENEARETAIAGLGERIVEGAEEPAVERANPGAARGTDRIARPFCSLFLHLPFRLIAGLRNMEKQQECVAQSPFRIRPILAVVHGCGERKLDHRVRLISTLAFRV